MKDLNPNFALDTAKSFTQLAIEHGLITKGMTNEETANKISSFMETIYNNLVSGKE